MGDEAVTAGSHGKGPWPILDMHERRVLGVLVEKAKTTPDAYPLSINALTSGSNQKSNRDPLLNLSDFEVEDALSRCKDKGLAVKITGGRVIRWRHYLYEAWMVDKLDLAILAELLLRGPQTEGELRSRAARMEAFDDLDALRRALRPLVERGLVVYLTAEDRRGAMLTHGFHGAEELAQLRARASTQPVRIETGPPAAFADLSPAPARAGGPEGSLAAQLADTRDTVVELKAALQAVRAEVTTLRQELQALKQSLGA
jgi:uncharacterized protein YceH (UPF0502 family)